ncbi:hypothetical protein STEG23_030205, partial [Scotinomys teguina]
DDAGLWTGTDKEPHLSQEFTAPWGKQGAAALDFKENQTQTIKQIPRRPLKRTQTADALKTHWIRTFGMQLIQKDVCQNVSTGGTRNLQFH